MKQTLIAQGAEAKIFLIKTDEKTFIKKQRIPKEYRFSILDNSLRKKRTRREAKILGKLTIPGPKLIKVDEKNMSIEMEYIDGEKVKNLASRDNCKKLGEEIGIKIAKMHNADIIHGDLTTSNMIHKDEIYFIDFGLSFFSKRIEDRAVDLHLIKEALQSTHHKFYEEFFQAVINGYKKEKKDSDLILKQLKEVELRGRYRHKSKN